MKKVIASFSLIMISIVMFAQADYSLFTRDIRSYSDNYSDDQVMGLYENHYGVPRNTLVQLFGGFGYDWGNVALGLEISNFLGLPLSDLLGDYRNNKGNGWGVMAKRYGIKPGSAEFHRMKEVMSNKNRYWRDVYNDYGQNRNPAVARRNRVVFNDQLIILDGVSNKEIEKRNKKIDKREKKMMKEWEKENKKIRKQTDKMRKEQGKQMKKSGKW
ncbi:MAG: hypothetical protein JJE08_09295 [Proteiniphilum sp.]|nr:hypothetical protein [Proteiniphilum sp.]